MKPQRTGFTLIELLVVVAIIALLISILLPSLAGAREQGKRAVCLANLKSIGTSIHGYATEDKAEQPIPIHRGMIEPAPYWVFRTADWFSWGGRDAQREFIPGVFLKGGTQGYKNGIYGAKHRPLNYYIYGRGTLNENDVNKMPLFRCPSDQGYPRSAQIDDCPPEAQEKTCYDVLGNSYRASKFALYGQGQGEAFALGPYGHRMSTLANTGKLILAGEPTFFNMIGMDNGQQNPDPVVVIGWHKRLMTDNLIFVDGHARSTLASGHRTVDAQTARKMGVYDLGWISRGPTWTFDCYPTPGAVIWGGTYWNGYLTSGLWPFRGAQKNLCTKPTGGPCD